MSTACDLSSSRYARTSGLPPNEVATARAAGLAVSGAGLMAAIFRCSTPRTSTDAVPDPDPPTFTAVRQDVRHAFLANWIPHTIPRIPKNAKTIAPISKSCAGGWFSGSSTVPTPPARVTRPAHSSAVTTDPVATDPEAGSLFVANAAVNARPRIAENASCTDSIVCREFAVTIASPVYLHEEPLVASDAAAQGAAARYELSSVVTW
jgi:hypothetical protein